MILRYTFRNLIKRPFLNLIKILGLSLALSAILLILLFLKNELTFDKYHSKSDRIYRFTVSDNTFAGKHFARVNNAGYVPKMADYFPDIENYVRLAPVRGGVIRHNEEYILVNQAFECDSTFFELFDVELITGDPENILDNPGSMVISESFAKKTFGNQSPLGQILTLPSGQYYGKDIAFTVKGIMKDFPQNSHFHPEFITTPIDKTILNGWAWTYFLLSNKTTSGNIVSGFKEFYSTHVDNKADELEIEAHLQKISDIHLHSNKLREIEPNSNMSAIFTLAIAALVLLFIAVTNYSNLNIGMAGFSDKFLFIRKVSGSSVWMNLQFFLFEGIIIVITSVILSSFIIIISDILIQKQFGLNLLEGNMVFIISFVLLFSLLGILSGFFPLLKQGIRNIKSTSDRQNKSNIRRKGISKSIIVLQYTISIALIVAVIAIRRQTNFALESSMGVDSNNIIILKDVHTSIQQKFGIFKDELLKYNSIGFVSAMLEPPGGEANDMFKFTLEGYIKNEANNADEYIGIFPCDYSFASVFNLNFLSGTNFSEKNEDNEGSGEYIINMSALKRLGYTIPDEIIGKEFGLIFDEGGIKIPKGKIIGVVEDFHLSSIKKGIEPLVLFKRKELWLINFIVSFKPGMKQTGLADTRIVWTKMFPGYPFQYEYVDSMYKNVYKTELLQAALLSLFTIIALFICSMGLLGMSLLTTQRRTKEIGLRKINGAGIGEMMLMLNWDFIKWIIISFVLAIPFACYAMTKWLENFAYKTSLSWWIFALAGLSALVIATLTVSLQSWKVSTKNPVETLRYE
jgi:putative ABC transport system permease protein